MAECLFNNSVPVHLKTFKGGDSPAFNDNFSPSVTTQFSLQNTSPQPFYSTSTPVHYNSEVRKLSSINFEIYTIPLVANKRSIQLRISDPSDPFFMFQLDLNEEDFYPLKQEQNLVIDFTHFPYKLVELLGKCISSAVQPHPAITAQLTTGSDQGGRSFAILSFIETTSFRQVSHLTLKLKSLNEDAMKKRLFDMLKQYKTEISSLRSQLSDITKSPQFYHSTQPFPPSDYLNLADKYRNLEEKLAQGEAAKTSTIYPSSSSSTNAQILGLQTALREKESQIGQLNELLQVTKDGKRQSDDLVTELKKKSTTQSEEIEKYINEINKANDIIRKLQDEIRTLKSKLKSNSTIMTEQDKLCNDLKESFNRQRVELDDLRSQLRTDQVTKSKLESENSLLKSQLSDTRKIVENQEQVLEYLNKTVQAAELDRAMKKVDFSFDKDEDITKNNFGNETFTFENFERPYSNVFK